MTSNSNFLEATKGQKQIFVLFVLILGTLLRCFCGLREPNHDYYSWEIVSDLFTEHKTVYISTSRYNYGPIWFHVIGFLKYLDVDFRFGILMFLTLVDIAIFYLLLQMNKFKESILFFLCPISIIISGYHHQFENFAILPVFFSVYYITKKYGDKVAFDDLSMADVIILSILMGVSLSIKHIFILFPLWLFFQSHHIAKRVLILIIPVALFLASFCFYWNEAKSGIVANVFNYASFNNFPFYQIIYFDLFDLLNRWNEKSLRYIFIGLTVILGFILRRRSILDSFLYYTACFVCFSSAVANQYLVIPIIFLSFYFNTSSFFYYLISGLVLIFIDRDGLHFLTNSWPFFIFASKAWYKIVILFLFISIISSLYKKDLLLEFLSYSYRNITIFIKDAMKEAGIFFGISVASPTKKKNSIK